MQLVGALPREGEPSKQALPLGTVATNLVLRCNLPSRRHRTGRTTWKDESSLVDSVIEYGIRAF